MQEGQSDGLNSASGRRAKRSKPGRTGAMMRSRPKAASRRYDFGPPRKKPLKKITNPRLLAMSEKIRSEEGRRVYAKRKSSVEPTFGIIKGPMGFRQFLLRGMEKVSTEWALVYTAYNLKRLWALKPT